MSTPLPLVEIVPESRGGDAPYGWSENALHLRVLSKNVATYRESSRDLAEKDKAEWEEIMRERGMK